MGKWKWKNTQLDQFDAGKIWKNFAAYSVLALAVGAMTFFGVCDPSTNTSRLPGGDAGSVDGLDISGMAFRRAYQQAYERYQSQFKDQFDPKTMNLSSRVLDELVNNFIIYNEALKSGVFATEQEITNLILDQDGFRNEKGAFDGKRFSNYLRNQGYSEQSFEDELHRLLTSDKFRKIVNETYRVSDGAARLEYKMKETKLDVEYIKIEKSKINVSLSSKDIENYLAKEENKKSVKTYYDSHQSEFNSPKKVKALHILSSHKGARNASGEGKSRTEADAEKRAKLILDKVNAKGADFKKLATELTDDPSGKTNGGDLGFFEFESMVKPFSEAAFKTKPGNVVGPIKSPFGYHVIKVLAVKEKQSTKLAQAEKAIAQKQLKKSKAPKILQETANSLLADLKSGSKDLPDRLQALSIEWQSTGPFAANARFIPSLGSAKEIKDAVLSLKKDGETYNKPIESGGAYYLVRLKTRKEADESQITKDKLTEIAEGKKLFAAYSFFNNLSKMFQEDYRKQGKISLNIEYQNYDLNRGQ